MQEKYITKQIEDFDKFFNYVSTFKELLMFYEDNGYVLYKYNVGDEVFFVYESKNYKITTNCKDYNCGFNKNTGYTIKFGSKIEEDPDWCKLGPEIMDLEISVNGCPKVGGHNCKFCYKNNSDAPATNMTFDDFKKIIDSIPKSLNQIAFGITGVQTNPDFPRMLRYCKENGIIPNYTMSGADLNDEILEVTKECCGAVAVSCYEGNKELCYNTIAKLGEKAPNVHVNMHIVLSKGTLDHVMDVLNDVKKDNKGIIFNKKNKTLIPYMYCNDERLENLRHVVFLRIKPVGRASKLDTTIPLDIFRKVVDFCQDHNIGFGFDSCTAPDIEKILKEKNQSELCNCCERCESTKFSIYISTDGKITPCSFCEKMFQDQAIDMINNEIEFSELWNNNKLLNHFRSLDTKGKSCPIYQLDNNE